MRVRPRRTSIEEEHDLSARALAGDVAARDELVLRNIKLVRWCANKYRRDGVSLDDLESVATIGLIEAAKKYDARKGVRFGSYAVWGIYRRLSVAVEEYRRLLHVPVHQLREAPAETRIPFHRSPGQPETDWVPDEKLGQDGDQIQATENAERCALIAATLNPVEFLVISRRFGLDGCGGQTLKEIGDQFGRSRERIRQIEAVALDKLRRAFRVPVMAA